MGRAIGAVVVAFLLWTVLWLGFNSVLQAALPDIVVPGRALTHTGALLAYLVWSVVISLGAGFTCAAVRKETVMKTVWVFAFIQLAVGIGFETANWALTPAWYHIVFLALLVPATVWGGRLRAGPATA